MWLTALPSLIAFVLLMYHFHESKHYLIRFRLSKYLFSDNILNFGLVRNKINSKPAITSKQDFNLNKLSRLENSSRRMLSKMVEANATSEENKIFNLVPPGLRYDDT